MPDYSAYQIDLDTPQPGGGRGESPRSAFTKVNELMVTLGTDIDAASEAASAAIPASQKGEPGGVCTLDANGLVPEEQLPPIPSGPAVGTPDWWPLRSSIPAGQIPQDGQIVLRATYPDLAAMVIAGTLPVVAEATWQSDPTQRGKYTLGDGSTTIRLPDLNGKASGSLGAVVRRGDGAMSAGTGGLIQRDALQNIEGAVSQVQFRSASATTGAFYQDAWSGGGKTDGSSGESTQVRFDASRVARTASETRPLNVTGVWTVHAFGAVANPGGVDAAQLASDLAALDAAFQSLASSIGFTYVYPGGTSGSPGAISVNTRLVVSNPFPGFAVMAVAEIRTSEAWFNPGFGTSYNASAGITNGFGVKASQLSSGEVIVQSGEGGVSARSTLTGGGEASPGNLTTAPIRVRVWKIGGPI